MTDEAIDWANPLVVDASSWNVPLVILPPDIAKSPVATVAMPASKQRIKPKPSEIPKPPKLTAYLFILITSIIEMIV